MDSTSAARSLFRRGARVKHTLFGEGEVVRYDDEHYLTVRFDDGREVGIWQPQTHLQPVLVQPNGTTATPRPIHPELPFEPMWVPLERIRIDREHYQRTQGPEDVAALARHLNRGRAGAIDVSLRPDGYYYCYDGGHRVEALRALGEKEAYCHVRRGLTLEQEAAEFVALNRDRSPVTAVGRFKGRVAAGDPIARTILAIVADHGYHIDYSNTRRSGGLSCVGALEALYRSTRTQYKSRTSPAPTPERLHAVLDLVARTWDRHPDACSEMTLRAVDYLLRRYGAALDQDRFVAQLRGLDLDVLRKQAAQQRRLVGMSDWLCLAARLLKIYNNNLRSNRLPGFGPDDDGASLRF
jgi:hypothetical protein